jgi:tRNA(Arg) A34 adenosine deaminase TadA
MNTSIGRDTPPHELRLTLPDWLPAFLAAVDRPQTTMEARMGVAIGIARTNVERMTGGPFGAVVFERDSGILFSAGVNCVVPQHCSAAHAEVLALALAQQRLRSFTLAAAPQPLQLVTTAEPCAMCLGAIAWSGVSELVTGATDADARGVGFDEGTKPPHWTQALTERGIHVVRGVLRGEARDVLRLYAASGGRIYNP